MSSGEFGHSQFWDAAGAEKVGLDRRDLMTSTWVWVETSNCQIRGRLHHPKAGRMSEFLNETTQRFINLTDVTVKLRNGDDGYETAWMAVSVAQVEALIALPVDEQQQAQQQAQQQTDQHLGPPPQGN